MTHPDIVPEPHDEFPDLLAGELVAPEHSLDIELFDLDWNDEEPVDVPPTGQLGFPADEDGEQPLESRSWYTAPSIEALQAELTELFPSRTLPDWVIGDADHSSRVSDHNPDSRGMVHAVDIRLGGGLDVKRLLEGLIGDPRAWYVIHNWVIYSRTYGWEPRRYTGSNGHTSHVHLSLRYTEQAERDISAWLEPVAKRRTRPVPISLEIVREQFLRAMDLRDGKVVETVHVKRLQRSLNVRTGARLKVDGLVGKQTLNAWGRWERSEDGQGRPRVPDRVSLGRLVQPRWRMV